MRRSREGDWGLDYMVICVSVGNEQLDDTAPCKKLDPH